MRPILKKIVSVYFYEPPRHEILWKSVSDSYGGDCEDYRFVDCDSV
jgi:hypothetical protein